MSFSSHKSVHLICHHPVGFRLRVCCCFGRSEPCFLVINKKNYMTMSIVMFCRTVAETGRTKLNFCESIKPMVREGRGGGGGGEGVGVGWGGGGEVRN